MKSTLIKFLIIVSMSVSQWASGDDLSGDRINTSQGDLIIHPILHSTLAFQWDGKVIFVDPYGGEASFADLPDPDLIVITDIHGDHMNIPTLSIVVKSHTKLIAPAAVVELLPESIQSKAQSLPNHSSIKVLGVEIVAIPMYNLPETTESRHPKGRGNGYVMDFGGQRVYISGDTDDIPEMRTLKDIDIAFVCMNPPNTMSVEAAADAVIAFSPGIVFPFHFRSQVGMEDVNKFVHLVNEGNKDIEVRIRQWYPQ